MTSNINQLGTLSQYKLWERMNKALNSIRKEVKPVFIPKYIVRKAV